MEEACVFNTGQLATLNSQAGDSDSDNEPITLLRRKTKLRLDADSDEENDVVNSITPSAASAQPPETSNLGVDGESDSSEKTSPKAKASKRRIMILNDSSDEDENPTKPLKSYGFRNKPEQDVQPTGGHLGEQDGEENLGITAEGALEVDGGLSFRNKVLANSDLFDAEGSSGDELEHGGAGKEDGVSLNDVKKAAHRSKEIAAKPLKAAKRPKPKKGDLQQLHSESQRMMRKSRVSLPYHVPQQRTLDDFLNRKKIVPNVIRPSAKETESILKHIVKDRQKPIISSLSVNAELSLKLPEHPELSYKEANIEETIQEPSINTVKRRLDLELTISEATTQCTQDNAETPERGDENKNMPTSVLPNSDSEDDLPDLEEAPSSRFHPHVEVQTASNCSTAASDIEKPESGTPVLQSVQNLGSDNSAPLPKCNPMAAEAVTPASDHDTNKFKIPEEQVTTFKPRLSGAPHMTIDLDEPRSSPLLGNSLAGPQKMVLSILKKEKDDCGEERLVNENLTITLSDRSNSQTPGSTLLGLKEKLKAEIAKRRAEARQKRLLMRAEDDEEGFEGDHEHESESEEEEILSDPTDSEEDDEEDECEIIGKELKKTKKPKSKFIEDEAEDEDDPGRDEDDDEDEDEDKDNSEGSADESSKIVEKPKKRRVARLRLRLESDSSEDESPLPLTGSGTGKIDLLSRLDTVDLLPSFTSDCRLDSSYSEGEPRPALTKDRSLETSFELMGSLVPAHQPGGGIRPNQTVTPLKRQYSTLSLPIENSQDLFSQHVPAEEPHYPLLPFDNCAARMSPGASPKPVIQPKMGLFDEEAFSIQENTNELYDLCSGKWADSAKTETRDFGALCDPGSPKNTQETMDELFGLCSGKFVSKDDSNVKRDLGIKALCDSPSMKDTQGNMDELFDLCSGKFTAGTQNGLTGFADSCGDTQDLRPTVPIYRSDDELSISSFKSSGPRVKRRPLKRILSDAESDEEDCPAFSDEEEVDAESVLKEKKRMKEYFEDEAELSGSDVPSDEDDEIAEEDDILEEELGDLEELGEEELKNQVEKVHMKMMMDDDQRQLRLYKEMYLEDGDLHTEGQGRVRKFRWRNVDDDSNGIDGGPMRNSEGEGEDCENDAESAAFRMQRHEREKWLSEHKKSHKGGLDAVLDDAEASQFKPVKQIRVLRRSSSLVIKASNSPNLSPMLSRQSPNFCGSFLARGKDALAKIAELTKGSGKDGLNGPRNSRNFVFAAVSPTKEAQPETPKLRRASSTPTSALPAAKKCRREALTPVSNNDSSIFDLL